MRKLYVRNYTNQPSTLNFVPQCDSPMSRVRLKLKILTWLQATAKSMVLSPNSYQRVGMCSIPHQLKENWPSQSCLQRESWFSFTVDFSNLAK